MIVIKRDLDAKSNQTAFAKREDWTSSGSSILLGPASQRHDTELANNVLNHASRLFLQGACVQLPPKMASLLKPFNMGSLALKNRVVLSPLTRAR
jgi:hypothetical protein